uniref:Uncharacterized protein n=1 Tax=Anguilla anguilla TaxID=7936 RepID=A0A0E9VFE7_ANGAN
MRLICWFIGAFLRQLIVTIAATQRSCCMLLSCPWTLYFWRDS